MSDENRNPHDGKRVLVTFGRSDPLHLTEATHELLGRRAGYIWGPDFNRPKPEWAGSTKNLKGILDYYDVVYCGHGATLLEATAAGCEVKVFCGWASHHKPVFIPAWTSIHLDHSGKIVEWWKPGVMESMSRELVDRRRGGSTRSVEAPTTGPGGENPLEPTLTAGGASWVHQAYVGGTGG